MLVSSDPPARPRRTQWAAEWGLDPSPFAHRLRIKKPEQTIHKNGKIAKVSQFLTKNFAKVKTHGKELDTLFKNALLRERRYLPYFYVFFFANCLAEVPFAIVCFLQKCQIHPF